MDSLNTHGLDLQAGAKALVPNEFRPISDKASWGQPLLTRDRFLGILAVTIASSLLGLILYYSFYVAFILSSVEAFSSPPKSSTAPHQPIAGSYRRIMRHIVTSYGWRYFIGGAGTFVWTALLAFVGRWALSLVVPSTSESTSSFALLGGSDVLLSFILEPLNIVFTHRILTHSNFSSLATLKRISRAEIYVSLVYIGAIRVGTTMVQSGLLAQNATQHYSQSFATGVAYITLMFIQIVLITRIHASLLPPMVAKTVVTAELEPGVPLWQLCLRILKMFKLLFVCVLLAVLHAVITLAGFVYTSGLSQKVIDWAYSAKQAARVNPARDPGLIMIHDPELDPHRLH